MISAEELLTTYWSQTTLVLLGVAYLIQRGLNIRSKKIEINHTLFQQKRLEAVNNFFEVYARTEQMWRTIPIVQIIEREVLAIEVDRMIWPLLNEMKTSVLQLQIFFNYSEHETFRRILENMKDINSKLSELYFKMGERDHIVEMNEFTFLSEQKLKENEVLFVLVSKIFRNQFD